MKCFDECFRIFNMEIVLNDFKEDGTSHYLTRTVNYLID
jgi:hypothetical protein